MSDGMKQKDRDLFACTEVLAKAILDREWKVDISVRVEIRVETIDDLIIIISLDIGGQKS